MAPKEPPATPLSHTQGSRFSLAQRIYDNFIYNHFTKRAKNIINIAKKFNSNKLSND